MRRILGLFFFTFCQAHADTINNYMNIVNNIPQMEIKADAQAQAWARSARNVLTITSESIAETLKEANEEARRKGNPLYCLPQGVQLNSAMMNELIQQTYKDLSSQQSDKDTMTVSQVALLAVSKNFSCTSKITLNEEAKVLIGQQAQYATKD